MRVLGIDPGIHGGMTVLEIVDGAAPTLTVTIDIPTVGAGAKERVDPLAIRTLIIEHRPQIAFIERGGSMPRQGVASAFKYGRAIGAIEAVITCCEIPLSVIEPSIWKRYYKLHGKDKEGARQRALQLFPSAHAALARKKDHGRAEAALIALYGAARQEANRAAA